MDKLDAAKKEHHAGTEIVSKKQLEIKFLGAGRRPFKGAKLWGLDKKGLEVYEINIQSKQSMKVAGLGAKKNEEAGTHRVQVDPSHPLVWAMNKKNALKKFMKLKFRV